MNLRMEAQIPDTDSYRYFWEEFANAIILLAVKDYRKALKRLKKRPGDPAMLRQKRSCERFFLSWWFGILSDADPNQILNGIKEENV